MLRAYVFIASEQWCKDKVRLRPYKRECLDIAQLVGVSQIKDRPNVRIDMIWWYDSRRRPHIWWECRSWIARDRTQWSSWWWIHSRDHSEWTIDNRCNEIARQLTSVSMGLHDDDARTNTSNRVSACWLLKQTISSEKNLPSIDHSFWLLTINQSMMKR